MAAIAAVALMSSCSGGGKDEPQPAKLVLKADKTSVDAGATVTFTVTQNGEDVTDKTTICTLDGGICLPSNKFVATDAGSFTFTAKFKDGSDKQESNQVKVTVKAVSLKLLASTSSVEVGKSVTFQVTLSGADVTDQMKIVSTDGSNIELPSNTWNAAEVGEYTFQASYRSGGTEKSNELSIIVKQPEPEYSTTWNSSKTPWKNVMQLTFTGDWCNFCWALKENIKEMNVNRIVEVYAYDNGSTGAPFNSSEYKAAYNNLASEVQNGSSGRFSIGASFPGTIWEFDRQINGSSSVEVLKPEYEVFVQNPAKTGIKVVPTVSGTNLNLSISVGAKDAGNYWLAAMLVEDDIKSFQTTHTGKDENYTHKNVFRNQVTTAYGDDLGEMSAGQEVTKTYNNIALKYTVANMSVVVYTLYKKADGKFYVANSVKAPLNKTTGYAYVK